LFKHSFQFIDNYRLIAYQNTKNIGKSQFKNPVENPGCTNSQQTKINWMILT
jgi:hypothetical protein